MVWKAFVAGVVSCALLVIGGGVAGAQPLAPIYPAGKVKLAESNDAYEASFPVINPSNGDLTLTAAESGTGAQQNACTVKITGGDVLPASRTTTVTLAVSNASGTCDDPADGVHPVVLIASGAASAPERFVTSLAVAEGTSPPPAVEATGLKWPDDAVFLKRRDSQLEGEISVFNPTAEDISVAKPTAPAGCTVVDDPERPAFPSIVPAEQTADIPLTFQGNCDGLDTGPVAMAVTASSGDKADTVAINLEAEVDWDEFGQTLLLLIGLGVFVAAVAAAVGLTGPKSADGLNLFSVMRVDGDAPASWLTAIAAIGPLLVTLVTSAGLSEGMIGAESSPQSTLLLGSSAVALALAGVAGIITNAPLRTWGEEGETAFAPVVAQFAVGAGLVAASACFQVWGIYTALSKLDLAIWPKVLAAFALSAGAAILIYLYVSVFSYVTRYAAPDSTKEAGDPGQPDCPAPALRGLVSPPVAQSFVARATAGMV